MSARVGSLIYPVLWLSDLSREQLPDVIGIRARFFGTPFEICRSSFVVPLFVVGGEAFENVRFFIHDTEGVGGAFGDSAESGHQRFHPEGVIGVASQS